MTEIESKKVTVNNSAENIYNFLLDLNNFYNLLPTDKISDWESDGKSCVFKVSGSVTISLVQQELDPFKKIILSGNEKAPFKYELHIFLDQKQSGETDAWQVVKADINPFIKMMVEKPLKNLFDFVADKLTEKYA